jgi:hypothetical protein
MPLIVMFIVTSQSPGLTLSGCTLPSAKRTVAEARTAPSKIIFRIVVLLQILATLTSSIWPCSSHYVPARGHTDQLQAPDNVHAAALQWLGRQHVICIEGVMESTTISGAHPTATVL